jgi:two-component system, cell cycle sensor histidine kinase and response regulator CckA
MTTTSPSAQAFAAVSFTPTGAGVLIVDDTPASLELLAGILEVAGYEVRSAASGRDALSQINDSPPELVLLDISMPDMDGFEVCKRLKQSDKLRDIPVIFLTALSDPADKVKAFDAGGVDYVTKPFHADEVLSRVNAHMGLRRASAALAKRVEFAESRFTAIFRESPVPLAVTEQGSGRFLSANKALLTAIGATSYDQILGKTSLELGLWASRDARDVAITETTLLEPQKSIQIEVRKVTGEVRSFDFRTAPYELDGKGYLLTACLDITDRLRAEADRVTLEDQLRQAQKMEAVGRLAGGIAHDFNNLLTVIIGSGQLLLAEMKPDRPEVSDIEEMVKAGERAAEMTRQLLAFSRRQVIEPREIGLNGIVGSIEKMLKRMIGEDVKLKTVLAPDLGVIRADPGQLDQVLANLAINARDAMPEGGSITMTTANIFLDEAFVAGHADLKAGEFVRLSVSDTGSGMTAETRARIFEPFFTTKDVGKGTGLGLSTVFGIVKQAGGHIEVDTAVGRGTTFELYFPRIEPAAHPIAAADPVTAAKGAGTILVVEDNAPLRSLTGRMLRDLGYAVLLASGPDEAMIVSDRHDGPIDLLLTDVVMPGMSGRALANGLTRMRPAMKVLFASGYADEELGRHGVLDSGIALLPKPFTPITLGNKVREVLTR